MITYGHQAAHPVNGYLRTTEVYMHVTQPGTERLQEILDRLMVGL